MAMSSKESKLPFFFHIQTKTAHAHHHTDCIGNGVSSDHTADGETLNHAANGFSCIRVIGVYRIAKFSEFSSYPSIRVIYVFDHPSIGVIIFF
jgi:hypothetical protein